MTDETVRIETPETGELKDDGSLSRVAFSDLRALLGFTVEVGVQWILIEGSTATMRWEERNDDGIILRTDVVSIVI